MNPQLRNPKFYLMLVCDGLLFALALWIAYLLRFEFAIPQEFWRQFLQSLLWIVPLKLFIFVAFGLYRGMWRFTGVHDLWRLLQACLFSTLSVVAVILILWRFEGFSRAVYLLDGMVTILLTGGLRMMIKSYYQTKLHNRNHGKILSSAPPRRKPVLIVGAGSAGEKILREIREAFHLNCDVLGFVDDDRQKIGKTIHGVAVLGSVDDLPAIVAARGIEEILIALPSASGEEMRRVTDICRQSNVPFKTLPGLGEIIDGRVSVKALRDVRYEDLLGRQPVELDTTGIQGYLQGKTVLITGCGGSIGSELCRQVIKYRPKELLLLDAGESNLFTIQMELEHEAGFHSGRPILAHVQDRPLIERVFATWRPEVVFHAAAYKHVPLMEWNPWEAVTNNIMGSKTMMELAVAHQVEKFVLVSTDKAVNPSSVMGASKRVAELLMQSLQGGKTKLMTVRFGNVVGSSGSVVPLFRRQIEQGGPVTVTHPEVTRYFMTIPEASQLILQAALMGEGGEIFILKMGRPVRIVDMAMDLIRLSGREPDRDIRVVFTGLRAGEKLYEELITVGEGILPTAHDQVMVLRPDGLNAHEGGTAKLRERLDAEVDILCQAARRHDSAAIKERLRVLVPEYDPR